MNWKNKLKLTKCENEMKKLRQAQKVKKENPKRIFTSQDLDLQRRLIKSKQKSTIQVEEQ